GERLQRIECLAVDEHVDLRKGGAGHVVGAEVVKRVPAQVREGWPGDARVAVRWVRNVWRPRGKHVSASFRLWRGLSIRRGLISARRRRPDLGFHSLGG